MALLSVIPLHPFGGALQVYCWRQPKITVLQVFLIFFFAGFSGLGQSGHAGQEVGHNHSDRRFEIRVASIKCEASFVLPAKIIRFSMMTINLGGFLMPKYPIETSLSQGETNLRALILQTMPDWVALQETPDPNRLIEFLQSSKLDRYYQPLIHWGALEDGVRSAMLVKKSIFNRYRVDFSAGTGTEIGDRPYFDQIQGGERIDRKKSVFPKTLPTLMIRSRRTNAALAVVLAVHAKSQRRKFDDAVPALLRRRQFEEMRHISQRILREQGEKTPIFILGDFNTPVGNLAEHLGGGVTQFENAFSLGPPNLEYAAGIAWSHIWISKDGQPRKALLDGLMVANVPYVHTADILSYRTPQGKKIRTPKNRLDFQALGVSDHRPVLFEVSVFE